MNADRYPTLVAVLSRTAFAAAPLLALLLLPAVPLRAQPLADAARAAVARALPLLQSSGEEWYESRACSSCHHAALNLLAVAQLRAQGFAVDGDLAGGVLARFRRSSDQGVAEIVQGDAGINAQIGQSYRLAALAAQEAPAGATTDAVVHFLAGKQQPDGRWRSESHRPPLEDSEVTATALSARALRLYAPPARAAEMAERARRAGRWLAGATPRDTEDRVMRLFGLAWTGAAPEELAAAAGELRAQQREDGGWAQIPTRASDAYATGSALVALHQAGGLAVDDPGYRRGAEFLLRTQLADGTWRVATRRRTEGLAHFETGFPHGVDQFISFAASCWAACALGFVAAPGPSAAWLRVEPVPREPDEAPGPLPPLARAAVRRETGALEALLAAGADANETGPGRITPLLAAAGDAGLVQRLLDHGADPAARSDIGLTPLQAAAAYEGGLESMRLLLARRATPPDAAELGDALRQAALAGDTRKVDLLLEAGADLRGAAPGVSPLTLAGYQGDADMIRHLVARGADPDPNEDGVTPLTVAVIDGQVEVVRLLLEAGADANARDGGAGGLTPLMWAATVDWGDTRVLQALLAHGADVQALADGGLTALSCARAHANTAAETLLLEAGAGE